MFPSLRRRYRGHGFLGRTTLFEIVEDARATGNELHAFLTVDDEPAATQLAIQEVIERYGIEFDAEAIAGRQRRRTSTNRSSMLATPEEVEEQRHRWSRRFTRLDSAANEIGALLIEVDAPAALRWHRHYLTELCPDLTRERWPDSRLAEWTQTQDLTAEQREAVADIVQRWQTRKWVLIGTAVAAGVRAMKANASAIGSKPKQLIYRQRCQEYDDAVLHVVAEVAGILSAEQQRDLAAEVSGRELD